MMMIISKRGVIFALVTAILITVNSPGPVTDKPVKDFDRVWPPKDGFKFDDHRLGTLTGEEEPVKHLQLFPQQLSQVKATFQLFHMEGQEKEQSLPVRLENLSDDSKQAAGILSKCKQLVSITHGFMDSSDKESIKALRDAHLNFGVRESTPICVLVTDWRIGAMAVTMFPEIFNMYYAQAAVNTITVGRTIAVVMNEFVTKGYVKESQIQLIGHSLGAQVTHAAAQWFSKLRRDNGRKGSKIARVTGLDPAARHFRGYDGAHIASGDGMFVDIIHTASVHRLTIDPHLEEDDVVDEDKINFPRPFDVIALPFDGLNGGRGDPDPLGDVDFYPNGGIVPQPGCICLNLQILFCSHQSAVDYYTDSLNKTIPEKDFAARPCKPASSSLPDLSPCPSAEEDSVNRQREATKQINFMGYHASASGALGKLFLHYRSPRLHEPGCF